MEKDNIVQCSISFQGEIPYLLIEFNPEIHQENILELVEVIKYSVSKKLNCMVYMAEVNSKGCN
jgi:hypothetical protein